MKMQHSFASLRPNRPQLQGLISGSLLILSMLFLLGLGGCMKAPNTLYTAFPKGLSETQIDSTAEALLAQMSLKEKFRQMSGRGGKARVFTKAGINFFILKRNYRHYSGYNRRLGIPPLIFTDGPRGVASGKNTCFPVAMARGASFDPKLERQIGEVMGTEARLQDANLIGNVCINVLRHPAWGRAQETYGEDPYHLGQMGLALSEGTQSMNVMACAKHFTANNIENSRFRVDVRISEKVLREVYLPQFKTLADGKVATFMSAYNQLNGHYCGENKQLLTGILREEWKYEGPIMSDWFFGVYDGRKAVEAGLDIEQPFFWHFRQARKAVKEGKLEEKLVDQSVRRILKTKIEFGTRTSPEFQSDLKPAGNSMRQVALEAAEESMVLLKNEGKLLPLNPSLKKIAVLGPFADTPNLGDLGSSNVRPPEVITPLEGLRQSLGLEKGKPQAGDRAEIRHYDGGNLKKVRELSEWADLVLIVTGYDYRTEGENLGNRKGEESKADKSKGGDRLDLHLPPAEVALIRAASEGETPVLVSVMAGSAVMMEDWSGDVEAILMLWYPGMEGGRAWANILTGKANPSGKLPFTIPQKSSDLPDFDAFAASIDFGPLHGYTLLERKRAKPAYPFGFGLSYTTFSLENIRMSTTELSRKGVLEVAARLTNTGSAEGAEVIQLYVGYDQAGPEEPRKLLRGFQKVLLDPGQSQQVVFEIPVSELAVFNEQEKSWEVRSGNYRVFMGNSSADAEKQNFSFRIR